MHRLDPGAEHLGHVRGVDEDQRGGAQDRRARRHALQPQRRHTEPDQVQGDEQRDAAEQVDVGGGERPDREEHRPA
jgi:hypothetical protein